MTKYLDLAEWRDSARQLNKAGIPLLSLLSVILTLYLAPTKESYANTLVVIVGLVVVALSDFGLRHLMVLKALLPLGLLSLYAFALDRILPHTDTSIFYERMAWGVLAFWLFFYIFATMRLGRRYLWVFFIFAVPALVHLLYMYADIISIAIGQDNIDIETIKDMPRVGRRYLSHALIPLLVVAFLVGPRVRPKRWLPAIFLVGLAGPTVSLALLDARAAYISLLGAVLAVAIIPPLRREFMQAAGRWQLRMRSFYAGLAALAIVAALVGYYTGKSRWTAMEASIAAAIADVHSSEAAAAAYSRSVVAAVASAPRANTAKTPKPLPFSDTEYWNKSIEKRCSENRARCFVDQSMYLRSAWMLQALVQLKHHPFGIGQRRQLMFYESPGQVGTEGKRGNTAGDNFVIEAALAYGFIGLALYGWLWCRTIYMGVLVSSKSKRKVVFIALLTIIGICIMRAFVDVLSYGLWYYWMALLGVMYGCIAHEGRLTNVDLARR